MRFITSIIFATWLLVSCSNNDQKGSENAAIPEEDSVASTTNENKLNDNTIAFINGTGFSKYAMSALPNLDWSRFSVTRFWKEDFMTKSTFEPEQKFYNNYGPFIKFSPDSSKFIDLDSYNVDIHKDKNGRLVGDDQGPDTEVSLVDPAKKERTRLVFLGPGNSVEDAAWIDNNNFVLFGLQDNEAGTALNAVVWQFNLTTKMVYLYELPDQDVVNKWKQYAKTQRLKSVSVH